MKRFSVIFFLLTLITFASCNEDEEIKHLLNANTATEIIEGAQKAAKSGNRKYVPLLLKNANKPWASTDLRYKGFTVYTEVMYSLSDILRVRPPHKFGDILESPDTVNINFYHVVWQKMNKKE